MLQEGQSEEGARVLLERHVLEVGLLVHGRVLPDGGQRRPLLLTRLWV